MTYLKAHTRRTALALSPRLRALFAERDAARARVHALEQQLLAASDETHVRDDYQYVFVVTYGRSGSTLLTGLLNAIDGYQIRGENAMATLHLYRYWAAATKGRARNSKRLSQPHQPWYGIDKFDPEAARTAIRQLLVTTLFRPDPGTRVTGFKEVGWWSKDYEPYILWMRDTFPGARFIFNTRNHEAVLASKWWANRDPDLVRAELKRREEMMGRMEQLLVGSTYRVHYDDYLADPDVLQGMYAWLGEPWDRDRVDAVMTKKHSY